MIEIRRQWLPIHDDGKDYESRVWVHDDIAGSVVEHVPPAGYVPGMLSGYVDGERITLEQLDAALVAVGWTRYDIEQALRVTPGPLPEAGETPKKF
jgi:hypothetical protein